MEARRIRAEARWMCAMSAQGALGMLLSSREGSMPCRLPKTPSLCEPKPI